MAETVPTWGYCADGEAKIFDLAPGESLPSGWADTPAARPNPPEAPKADDEAPVKRGPGRPRKVTENGDQE